MIKTGFPALDNLTGGFSERKGYLLYGDAREAATALALSFLSNASNSGRPVALVTERSANLLVEEASRFGFNLSTQIENGSLLLFEYPANISANARKLEDDSRIIREFQNLVGSNGIDRLVFDPVTPLLMASNSQAVANRFQRISSSFSGLGATTIYVLQGPGATEYVPACREAADGVLRLINSGSGTGKIVLEGWETGAPVSELEFGVVAGLGLVPVSRDHLGAQPLMGRGIERPMPAYRPERRAAFSFPQLTQGISLGMHGEPDKPRILLVHPDTAQRSALAGMLQKEYGVEEAHGAIDGMASLSDRLPDVLVLAPELRGISGAAIIHKLRQAGHNLPIIVVGSRIRRLSDQIALLRAGADACLEAPINEQLLNLHVSNLLCRVGRLKEPHNRHVEARKSPQVLNCTTDLEGFCHRSADEMNRSAELGLPVPVLVMHSPASKAILEELSSAMLMVTRSTDLVYVGLRGIAVLLPEARAVEPVLSRFYKSWSGAAAPVVDQPRVAGQIDVFEYLYEFIAERTGASFSGTPVSERERSKSIGVSGNGAKL